MRMIFQLRQMLLIAVTVVAVVAVGCSSEYEDLPTPGVTPDESLDGEDGVSVTFSLDVAEMTSATGEETKETKDKTRAGETRAEVVDSDEINDLWILQYDDNYKLVRRKYITDTSIFDAESFPLTIHQSAGSVYFLANVGESFGYSATAMNYYGGLGDAYKSISTHDDVECFMEGWFGVPSLSLTQINNIKLERNVAKVKVRIEDNLDSEEWELNSILTINIQDKLEYIPGYTASYANYPSDGDSSTTSYRWSREEIAAGISSEGLTFYLPINRRGTRPSNSTESDKTKYALEDATAIKIIVSNKYDPNQQVAFTFYLGADLIDDYNISRNNSYSYIFTLDGMGIADSRVEWYDAYYSFYKPGTAEDKMLFPNLAISTRDAPENLIEYEDDEWKKAMAFYPSENSKNGERLPTQLELMAMWVFKPDSVEFSRARYFSSTPYSDNYYDGYAWFLVAHMGRIETKYNFNFNYMDTFIRTVIDRSKSSQPATQIEDFSIGERVEF